MVNWNTFSKQMKLFFVRVCLTVFFSAPLYAGVGGDLNNFFNSLGYESNVTAAHAYQGQEAGYYSAGSIFARNRVRDVQLIHVDAPGYRSGCGGINLFFGGFSFISGSQIVDFLKNVLTDSAGYAFNLAMETTVPEIAHTLQYIQAEAAKMNNSNLNSCDAAEDLVGGIWPKTRASQQQVCQDIGSQSNAFSDWTQARLSCTQDDGKFTYQMNKASGDAQYKDRVLYSKNVVWDALQKNGFLSSDDELSELFMTLSGTIIFDDKGKRTDIPSLADDRSLMKALVEGGNAKIYVCKDIGSTKKCLSVEQGQITIQPNQALINQVNKIILDMVQKVKSDAGLSDEERGFVNSTSIPILKFISVLSELNIDPDSMNVTQYSEVIAEDILEQYLSESLGIIKASLAGSDYTPNVQQNIIDKLQAAQTDVQTKQKKAYEEIQNTLGLIQNVQYLEGQVSAHLSASMKTNLSYGN